MEPWLTIRAIARGQAPAAARHPRAAAVPIDLLRNGFVTRGGPTVLLEVLAGIVDLVEEQSTARRRNGLRRHC
ncbi:hypothetical protein ACQP1G_29320 [Nocardia sp. CA-107356]|uniref:hypothetical protein n=1 Tax=Nocardia sp. CA-107356 TaxID=3239972 RepID=UPI003D8AA136